jgi:asparagine synthase (glutamine-hydrolysing)
VCGIFGIVNPAQAGIDRSVARGCLGALAERGPDDSGWYETEDVLLGHRRLAVMDLSSAARQPMGNDDESVWLTFNGEIYRFWELRAQLEARGHAFRSTGDTEVILRGYEEWGGRVLERLSGMFALGIWDARERTLLLARDRLGKKPLFWARRRGALGFASLVRPLVATGLARAEVAAPALREFLFHNYVIGPRTIFRDVQLLPPGTWLKFGSGRLETGRFWELARARPRPAGPAAQQEFERLVAEATRVRLVSDAPLGVFLSGGVDSALVAALAQREGAKPLRTYSVGFEEAAFDERPKARRVAERLGTEHHEVTCRAQDVPGILARLSTSADHLIADQSMVPLARLALEAKRSVKVVLTGDGGDELLAGYPTYRALRLAVWYLRLAPAPLRERLAALAPLLPARPGKMAASALLARFLAATTGGLAQAHASWRSIFTHREISALLGGLADAVREWEGYARHAEEGPADWTLLQRAVYADARTWLVDSILAKVDRATMMTGLEARSPLLDHELFEFAFATLLRDPPQAAKRPLRRLAAALLGPELAAAPKEGFQTPFGAWFRGPLRPYLRESLAGLRDRLAGLLDAQLLERIEAEHASGRRDHGLKLWGLLALSEWSRLFPGLRVAEAA